MPPSAARVCVCVCVCVCVRGSCTSAMHSAVIVLRRLLSIDSATTIDAVLKKLECKKIYDDEVKIIAVL